MSESNQSDGAMREATENQMASKGGKASAAKLTPEERSERARIAAEARWEKERDGPVIPKATHSGEMIIGGTSIPCYVLDDGRRLISHRGLQASLGIAVSGSAKKTASFVAQFESKVPDGKDLAARLSEPICFMPKFGRSAYGFDAPILADICEVILAARQTGAISNRVGIRVAAQCEILVRGFARVGIIALVDEATGYQDIRDRLALQEILDKYLRKEFAAWARSFPTEFYRQIFRLRNWQWKGMKVNRPQCVANYTKDLVYARLAPGIINELEAKNPVGDNGRRKTPHYWWLTEDVGHPALAQHLHAVTALMKAADSWDQMIRMANRALPRRGDSLQLELFSQED